MLILLNVITACQVLAVTGDICRSFSGLLCDIWQPVVHAVVHDSSAFSLICAFVTAKYLCAEMDRRHLLLVHFTMSHDGRVKYG